MFITYDLSYFKIIFALLAKVIILHMQVYIVEARISGLE